MANWPSEIDKFLTICKAAVARMHMAHATITSKGQITIPRAIRQFLGLRTGSRIAFRVAGKRHVRMEPETGSVTVLKGICKTPRWQAVSLAQMRRAVRERRRLK